MAFEHEELFLMEKARNLAQNVKKRRKDFKIRHFFGLFTYVG
jgi:hypothetical protein